MTDVLAAPAVAGPLRERAGSRARVAGFLALTKPRITFLVVLTALVGFVVAAPGRLPVALLWWTLLGTALAASGASALNQFLEVRADATMRRTARRPLPAGRLAKAEAAAFGVGLAVAGVAQLALTVNLWASALAAVTVLSYLVLYTPLKRVTSLATVVGAVPGAIPPLIGWAAVRGGLDAGAWVLFTIVFLWQMPHFLALARIYSADYARAGFRMLSVEDASGASAGRQSVLYALALVPVSLLPSFVGLAGPVYFVTVLGMSLAFLAAAVAMAARPTAPASARRLFRASLLYLPALCLLLVFA